MKKSRAPRLFAPCLSAFWALQACGDATSGPDRPANAEDSPANAEDPVEEEGMEDAGVAAEGLCDVPSDPAELLAYLQRGDYKAFEHESAVHASTGPHGGDVLTYVNDVLADSLRRGNAEHPRCAASVKELFRGRNEVSGWAVFVKTEKASNRGKGYYWLETTSTRAGRAADIEGQGDTACVGCHSAGRDFFRAPWPLQ